MTRLLPIFLLLCLVGCGGQEPEKHEESSNLDIKVRFPKVVSQTLKDEETKKWYFILEYNQGMGDRTWEVHAVDEDPTLDSFKTDKFNTDNALFWNYSEGGDHSNNAKIKIMKGLLLFQRGALYHSAYDLEKGEVLVNYESPYHELVYSNTYRAISPRPSMGDTDRMLAEWKEKHLDERIKTLLK